MYFHGKTLRHDRSFDTNHVDVDSAERYWVSGPKRDRTDRRYSNLPVHVDEDVTQAYDADDQAHSAR